MPMADSSPSHFQYSQLMCDRDNQRAPLKSAPMMGWRKTPRHTRCKTRLFRLFTIVVVISFFAKNMCAQEMLRAAGELPEAPVPQTSTPSPPHQGSASITGLVADAQGAVIPGASITLDDAASHEKRTAPSDEQGSFTFTSIGAGIFSVTIEAKGFAPVVRTGVSLHAGESYQLSPVTMQIADASSTVQVSAQEQYELAQAQIKAEERQRFLFIIPNFFVSYVSNPVPLTARQKLALATRATLDPYHLINVGIDAGWEQWRNDYPGYGQGTAGYAKRYGAAYGNVISGDFIGEGVMPALLHQDPRYFYKGTGSIPSRIGYALFAIVRTKSDNGKWQPNYSGFLGGLAAGAISNSYLPPGDRQAIGNVVGGALQHFALRGIGTLEEEFLSRWVTTHVRDKGTIGHD